MNALRNTLQACIWQSRPIFALPTAAAENAHRPVAYSHQPVQSFTPTMRANVTRECRQ